ncbi:MAG: low molecular weight protein arginine phosphatase [Clostridia bacterium]|nr:low molecular weight protein arginine phosphatase [Clostridia bacterium]
MKTVLFVCTGNTCRSPMAVSILKSMLKEKEIKAKVLSAGISVNEGEPMAENACVALKKLGIRKSKHTATQITKQNLEKCDLILTMTENQKFSLPRLKKIICFKDLTGFDVLDPYGQDVDAYINVAKQIKSGLVKVVAYLEQGDKV